MSNPNVATDTNLIAPYGLQQFIHLDRQNRGCGLFSNSLNTALYAQDKAIAAVVVGSLLVIWSGLFGVYGFMYPSAIGTIGQTAHLWALWTISGSGALIGGIVISIGAASERQNRIEAKNVRRQEELYNSLLRHPEIDSNLDFIRNTNLAFVFHKCENDAPIEDKQLLTVIEKEKFLKEYQETQRLKYEIIEGTEKSYVILRTYSGKWQSDEVSHFQARILEALCILRDKYADAKGTSSF